MTPAERLIYAVGDIHGRDDLFAALIETIRADAAGRRAGERPVLVLVGDYVDRGPTSRQVIERALALREEGAFELRCLLGNHEQAMLDFLDRKTTGQGWVKHGGGPTMRSYGVSPPMSGAPREVWSQTRAAMLAAVPSAHVAFLRGLELFADYGDYLFVHAGVRPGVPLAQQDERDLLWIRTDFLGHEGGYGKVVVHGHTPTEEPYMGLHRIGLDTGAYMSGLLTAVRLEGADRSLLFARAGERPGQARSLAAESR
jgi:serine/threonine protein phosphatase 1